MSHDELKECRFPTCTLSHTAPDELFLSGAHDSCRNSAVDAATRHVGPAGCACAGCYKIAEVVIYLYHISVDYRQKRVVCCRSAIRDPPSSLQNAPSLPQ